HTPVTAAARAHQVVDADVGRLAQIRHRLLQRADVELKATRDADMAEEASGVVEDKAENPVLGARGTSSVQARHASDVTAQSASAKKFRQGSCPPDGVEHGVHPGKREVELEGKTDSTELTVAVLTEERHEIVDIAPHRKSSASPSLQYPHPCLSPYLAHQHGTCPIDRSVRSAGLRGFGLRGGSGLERGARKSDAGRVAGDDRGRREV